jgi:sugar phosphate isomerase/epimerase
MVFLRQSKARRTLLKLGGFGILTIPFLKFSKVLGYKFNRENQNLPKIGLHLGSLGKNLKKYPKETFQRLSYIGFAGMETPHTFNGLSINEYGKILKKSDLEVIAMHSELPLDKMSKEDILTRAKTFKCKRIIWHGLPENTSYRSEEGIAQLANKYNDANQFAKSNGLEFGINNHWWEFEKLANGELPFDILLNLLDPDIFFELDVYWIAVAGQDPVEIIRKLGPRAKMLQVKDGPATWSTVLDDPIPYPVLAVGTGTLDYPAIFEASNGHAEWIIVEIEACETDMIQALYESYKYLAITNKFGTGLK